jgi:hypothetical protein
MLVLFINTMPDLPILKLSSLTLTNYNLIVKRITILERLNMKTLGFLSLLLSLISLLLVAILGLGDSRAIGFGSFILYGVIGIVLLNFAERRN